MLRPARSLGPASRSTIAVSNNTCIAVGRPAVKTLGKHRTQTMAFLTEALKGGWADIESAGSELGPRLARAARVARILGVELAAVVALAPYGAYALSTYRRLPALPGPAPPPSPPQPQQHSTADSPGPSTVAAAPAPPPRTPSRSHRTASPTSLAAAIAALPSGRDGVAVHRRVPYGPGPRNVMDVYVPLPAAHGPSPTPTPFLPQGQGRQGGGEAGAGAGTGTGELRPVVFFVHGGVWASGEPWQYAPMAVRLAQQGLVVVVPTYTLYPEALAGTMVEEVSSALSWTLDHVRTYGGDPVRVSAVGHSAGGHLVAWALLRRAAAAEAAARAAQAGAEPVGIGIGSTQSHLGHVQQPSVTHRLSPVSTQQEHGASGHSTERGPKPGHGEEHRHGSGVHPPATAAEEPQGSGATAADSRDRAAYLSGAGSSLSVALHALRAVADAQLHPAPGLQSLADGEGEAEGKDVAVARAAAAAAARPAHAETDTRMPALFIGMSAVYDIAKHYEFERSRGVHELSMMKRAMGGHGGFAAASPSVILQAAADAATPEEAAAAAARGAVEVPAGGPGSPSGSSEHDFYRSFELTGDAIVARAGLDAVALAPRHPGRGRDDSDSSSSSSSGRMYGEAVAAGADSDAGGGGGGPGAPFTLRAAWHLPPCVVMGSCADHMVPWHEGAQLAHQLRRCGVPVRHLLYNHVGHGDFVMSWRPRDLRSHPSPAKQQQEQQDLQAGSSPQPTGSAPRSPSLRGLLPFAKDLVLLVTGRAGVRRRGAEGQEQEQQDTGTTTPHYVAIASKL